jgi:sugar lactone lactonase YvrE
MRRIGFMTVILVVAGCSQPRATVWKPPDEPVAWPQAPDPARVQLLGEITSSADAPHHKTVGEAFEEVFYGAGKPWPLISPLAVAVNASGTRVAIADTNGSCVHVFDLGPPAYQRVVGIGEPPTTLECPDAVTWCGEDLYIADSKLACVGVIRPDGSSRRFGGGVLQRPAGLAYCAQNDLVYVVDAAAHAVLAFERDGTLAFQFGGRGTAPGQFNFPSNIACGPDGTLAVSDSLNFRVQRFKPDGTPLGQFGQKGDAAGDLALPKGVAFDAQGHLWVVDAHFENVQGFTADGQLLMALGREGQAPGEFWLPAGLCIDSRRRMWVADTYNRRVQVFAFVDVDETNTD